MSIIKYRTPQKVYIDADKVELAGNFSKAVSPTTVYSDSNQSDEDKVRYDHFVSKMGEEGVTALYSLDREVIKPDYRIYEGKKKSWKEDLIIICDGKEYKVAVKTQAATSAFMFGLSWTFQDGKKRRDPILDEPDALVLCVLYDDTIKYAIGERRVCYIFPPVQIKKITWRNPKKKGLIGEKKVFMAEDKRWNMDFLKK